MPDLALTAGGPSETASTPGSSAGISIAASGTANTKNTTWTEFITSTAYDSDWMLVNWSASSAGGNGVAIDIGVGASTSEVALIPNIYALSLGNTKEPNRYALYPIRVPRGTRISARCQAIQASSTIRVQVSLIASPIGSPPGFGRCEMVGINLSGTTQTQTMNDAGGTAHTDGTWTQITAATSFAYKWLVVHTCNFSANGIAAEQDYLLDLAVGGSGSEVAFMNDLYIHANTLNDHSSHVMCFPVNLASGVRISGRYRTTSIVVGERSLNVGLQGVG